MTDVDRLRFKCTRCGNCCTDKSTLVNLTYLDILRIQKGLNLDVNEILEIVGFYIFEKKLSKDDEKKLVISPIETEKGLAFTALLKNSEGICYFYNPDKNRCSIYELRPQFCKTFPFSFELLKEKKVENDMELKIIYTEKGKKYCPGIEQNAPVIDYNFWLKVGKETVKQIKKNHEFIKKWNEAARKGEIVPSAKKFIIKIIKLDESY
ncbi:MAG: YkgJ family cysteine cluster protein [Promethearchaeota archaeon]